MAGKEDRALVGEKRRDAQLRGGVGVGLMVGALGFKEDTKKRRKVE